MTLLLLGCWVLLVGVVGLRVVKRRMHPSYLRQVTIRSMLWFGILGVVTTILAGVLETWPWLLGYGQVLTGVVLLVTSFVTLRNMKARPTDGKFADRDLPTVTIAIPARNETEDLELCLRSLVANDYPKLEILVLDDCSQQPKTADIIKSFAQDGVRFIPGDSPSKRWLAKNQAYQSLYEHASGDVIVFAGVDTRFGPSSVRQIVYQMLERNKRMVSVLPIRKHASLEDSYIQPMRYWWEIALPRKLFNRPAVLSTCWAIYRADVHALGTFKAVSRNVIPEQYFARELVETDSYSFLRSSAHLELETVKSVEQQRQTAMRLRYPQLHKRPEWVYVAILAYVLLLLGPLVQLPYLWIQSDTLGVTLVAAVLLTTTHALILRAADPSNVAFSILTFPVAVITDVFLIIVSMIRYEFFEIRWKDRNICLPVMHVYAGLPRLDSDDDETTADTSAGSARSR
jgi:glycosyltransferase involved in cell wall biosynthesis